MRKPMNAADTIRQAMVALRRGQHPRAIGELEQLVKREPNMAVAHNALGVAFASANRPRDAARAWLNALALQPEFPEALTNLGNLDLQRGDLVRAESTLARAAAGAGAPVHAHVGLGRIALLLGRYRDAAAAFERVRGYDDADPNLRSLACYAALLDPELDARAVLAVHREYEEGVAARLACKPVFANDRDPQRRLRLGYVSADFREHSVASFLEPLLRGHDRERFEIFAFSDVSRPDETTARLRALLDHYEPIAGMPHARVAELVRSERIDVLVDLAGHMQPNRLPVFAESPAPVTLTYLGYSGSTGMKAFSGRVCDALSDPADDPELVGPEPLLRIAGGAFAYQPPADAPDVAPERAASEGVVFGCMGFAPKLSDPLLESWAAILRRLPSARLLLKSKPNEFADVRARVLAVLAAGGVDAERVELLAAQKTRREHLATYARIDVALDTFPYNGVTTTCEALYMGVPVVTLSGDRHASRLGRSLLTSAGLESWVTGSREEYEARAVRAAENTAERPSRAELRARLLASPLCDGVRVARGIESGARGLFAAWCSR
jgi:protein O-GlcNAc transferase